MRARQRLSIPRRVFLGFALVLSVSGMVSVASLVQHQRTAATLRLLHEGYLPLALTIGEARAIQGVFDTLLDRLPYEHDTRATQTWLKQARSTRPVTLKKAADGIGKIEELAPPWFENTRVGELRRQLRKLRGALAKNEERYQALFAALDAPERQGAQRILADLRARERWIERRLGEVWETMLAQIRTTSASAAEQEGQSIAVLAALIFVSLLVGVAVTWWSQRVLTPLPRLQERVEAVARGDLVHRLGPTRDDEIGRLAREFERMVEALAARDNSLRAAAESLRSLQQMQEQIVSGLRAAVLVVDAEGVVRSGNPAAAALLNVKKEDVGQPLARTGLLERLQGLQHAISDVLGGAERFVLSAALLKGSDEKQLDVLVTPFGAGSASGQERSVLVVAEDVTQELRTKERLIQSERLAAIGRMAAHVTHEVRSPLSSIGLNVELLEDEMGDKGPEAKALLSAIKREIESLTAITGEYLRVARVPSPRLEPEHLGELVQSAVQFVRPELESSGVVLELTVDPSLPVVGLDEGQIRQVLMNLLKNAREAVPDGGRVQLEVRARDQGVSVRVADSGVGIEPEHRERIFDPFYTTKESGTGLGLPLAQQIVLAHGGIIHCESTPGQGTVFELWFPPLDS